jgi:NAD-dependent SIR2 family protein deacetylase
MPREFWEDVQPIIPKLITTANTSTAIVNTIPKFGPVHAFLSLLQSKGKLFTAFTQNIDGLELAAGVDGGRIVKCHGSWDSATCITCKGKVDANEYLPVVQSGQLPLCSCAKPASVKSMIPTGEEEEPRRTTRPRKEQADLNADVQYLDTHQTEHKSEILVSDLSKAGKKRKRKDSDDESDGSDFSGRPGLLKPDITFFGEGVSKAYRPQLQKIVPEVDLLIIIGTSLPVEPVNLLPFKIPAWIPQVWISNERCKRQGLSVDVEILGDCGLVVEELCRLAGWTNALLNRLWRNNLGSTLQAKEAMKAKIAAAAAAARVAPAGIGDDKIQVKVEPSTPIPLRPIPKATSNAVEHKKDQRKDKATTGSQVKIEQEEGTRNRWLVTARRSEAP